MSYINLFLKMKELEFELVDKIKNSPFSLNEKDFIKKTQSYISILNESILFFRKEKIKTSDKILIITIDNKQIYYEMINLNDNNKLSKISMISDFYMIYGKFKFKEQKFEKDSEYRLFFSTSRGSIVLKIDSFYIEEDSFVYKISS